MAKKTRGKTNGRAKRATAPPRRKTVTHRVNRGKANGSLESMEVAPEVEKIPIGEAMRRAVEALGDVKIDRDLAPKQLAELADLYEDITGRQAAFDAKSEEAKTAKKSLESAQNLLLEKVRTFTHPAPLPLFDQAEREADHKDMLDSTDEAVQ